MQRYEDLPIACDLSERGLAARREEISTSHVLTDALRVEELPDGYAFEFAYDEARIAKLLAFINVERRCCRFLAFELAFDQNLGPLWLRLRGPEGTKDFIRGNLDAPARLA